MKVLHIVISVSILGILTTGEDIPNGNKMQEKYESKGLPEENKKPPYGQKPKNTPSYGQNPENKPPYGQNPKVTPPTYKPKNTPPHGQTPKNTPFYGQKPKNTFPPNKPKYTPTPYKPQNITNNKQPSNMPKNGTIKPNPTHKPQKGMTHYQSPPNKPNNKFNNETLATKPPVKISTMYARHTNAKPGKPHRPGTETMPTPRKYSKAFTLPPGKHFTHHGIFTSKGKYYNMGRTFRTRKQFNPQDLFTPSKKDNSMARTEATPRKRPSKPSKRPKFRTSRKTSSDLFENTTPSRNAAQGLKNVCDGNEECNKTNNTQIAVIVCCSVLVIIALVGIGVCLYRHMKLNPKGDSFSKLDGESGVSVIVLENKTYGQMSDSGQ